MAMPSIRRVAERIRKPPRRGQEVKTETAADDAWEDIGRFCTVRPPV
ncbi:hypothetical protein L13192_05485 [Pyrenophora tritici-repentis]|uniref:Uncharacterized protein n=1 Tax=Pyrenophora tritici-repentis TaxID=45151 RepID=A0A922SXD9_9PLEO|nr:hypothetical protein Ptr86124_010297 [Pyrenophora tritici-repentis]KAI1669969.1 hypothetical protein L13192_05485 [Pyrenophora tritici-repentis]KAI1681565.1 hypothetical protein KJE20_08436 [Pyrenophora tritici-repentis]